MGQVIAYLVSPVRPVVALRGNRLAASLLLLLLLLFLLLKLLLLANVGAPLVTELDRHCVPSGERDVAAIYNPGDVRVRRTCKHGRTVLRSQEAVDVGCSRMLGGLAVVPVADELLGCANDRGEALNDCVLVVQPVLRSAGDCSLDVEINHSDRELSL